MTTITSTDPDGYIAWHPSYPLKASSKYQFGPGNPDDFFWQTGKKIQEGDFVQQVYVWSKDSSRIKLDPSLNRPFPSHLPLRELLEGKEGETLSINVHGQTFTLLCSQRNSKNDETTFEDFPKYFSNYSDYPNRDRKERFCIPAPFSPDHYRQMLRLSDTHPNIPREELETIILNSFTRELTLSNQDLKDLFKKEGFLGSGGEGAVVRIRERKTGKAHALKISRTNFCDPQAYATIDLILTNAHSPHLIKIFQRMQIIAARNPRSLDPLVDSSDDFIAEANEGDTTPILRGYEMELMDGDLEMLADQLSEEEKMAFRFQIWHTHYILSLFEISATDNKWRNVFYKTLDEHDKFKGQRLDSFDFWEYTVNGVKFYVPKQKYVIKIGDFDTWRCWLFSEKKRDAPQFAMDAFGEAALEYFKKPSDPAATILDLS